MFQVTKQVTNTKESVIQITFVSYYSIIKDNNNKNGFGKIHIFGKFKTFKNNSSKMKPEGN